MKVKMIIDNPLMLPHFGHNSGARSPFETLTSALDRIFHAGSNGNSFKARNVQNNDEKVGPDKKIGTDKKIGPEKMKILTLCVDP